MNSFYRIVRDLGTGSWRDTGYGPYSTLYIARNVASGQFGGRSWRGQNSKTITRTQYDFSLGKYVQLKESFKIQKLTPVFKPFENGFPALTLGLEWVDVDAD